MTFDVAATCAGCNRPMDMPEGGGRHPVSGDGCLYVNADGPCDQCGGTRIKLDIVIE